MTDVLTPRERKDRLFSWRDAMEERGVPADRLPLKSDLEQVAKRQVESDEQLGQILLTRKDLVLDWSDHVLWVLNNAGGGAVVPPWGQPSTATVETQPASPAVSVAVGSAGSSNGLASAESEDSPKDTSVVFAPTDAMSRFEFAQNEIKVRLLDEGAEIAWPRRTDAQTVWYRVTSRSNYRPQSPERSDPIAVTKSPQCIDSRPLDTFVRHIAVWTYTGANDDEAAAGQPELWAEGPLVSPPQDVVVRERNGQVTGGWQTQTGIEEVLVFRVPVGELDEDTYPIGYGICTEADNLTGFVDMDPPPGASYEYRFAAMAEVSGNAVQSPFVVHRVDVIGVLTPVTDLRTDERDDGVYLSWTPPPLGQSIVFQTEKAPAAGPEDMLDLEALPSAGLGAERRLPMPAVRLDGRLVVGPVVDPDEWARTHYCVAVIAGNRAVVGPAVARARVVQIKDAEIFERVDHQLIVFDWPGDAVQVDVFLASPNSAFEPSRDQVPFASLTRQDFDKRGGLVMGQSDRAGSGRALSKPCRVYLVPATFDAGKTVPSKPTICDYPGLVRIGYRLDAQRGGIRGRSRVTVMATSEIQSPALSMSLVWRPDRLPLHRDDGTVIAQTQTVLGPAIQPVMDVEQLPPTSGFVRLFVAQSSGPRLAVIDPPLPTLRLS